MPGRKPASMCKVLAQRRRETIGAPRRRPASQLPSIVQHCTLQVVCRPISLICSAVPWIPAVTRSSSLPELAVTTAYHYTETVPVFFGHYWLRGTPVISGEYAACLDFSVAKNGFLAAYRWSGESRLSPDNIVFVKAH